MDLNDPAVSTGSGVLFFIIICLLVCLCCRKRQQQRLQLSIDSGSREQGHRPRGRRRWRRRRDNHDQTRVVIVDHEAPVPESAVPRAPYPVQPTQPPVHNSSQYIINLNPPSQMPFQTGHQPPPGPFHAHQQIWQQQQVLHNAQFPPPPQVSGAFPQVPNPGPYVQQQQQQPGGFAQLYAQAQPDMNVFPQPPPPYETEPFPSCPPTKQK